jgi:hypothetical protein
MGKLEKAAEIEKMRDLSGFGGFGRFCSPIALFFKTSG